MKNLFEAAGIKNLETEETTIIDDDGNVSELDAGEQNPFDFFADESVFGDDTGGWNLDSPFGEDEGEPEGLDFDAEGGEGLDGAMPEEGELGAEGEDVLGAEEGGEPTEDADPDFQGVIRTVSGACLVYKRKNEEGTFEELWVYGIGKNMRTEAKIRRSILAGTDISIQDVSSEDGTQECVTTTIGNVQYLKITGLPN